MKPIKLVLLLVIAYACCSCRNNDSYKFSGYSGEYFGLQPPSDFSEVFAHDLLCNSINTVFSPEGDIFFFVKDIDGNNRGDILWMRKINDKWTVPEPAPFNSEYTDNDICFSADGQKLFFRSWRPIEGISPTEYSSSIWFCNRIKNDEWSKPGTVMHNGKHIQAGYPSVAGNGNLYFSQSSNEKNGFNDLYCLVYNNNNNYTEKLKLDNDPFNLYNEGDMCISKDESFIVTACWERPDKTNGGESDLFITFRIGNNHWTELINLGEKVNSPQMENSPNLSPDGKYLFFNRYDGVSSDDYWISTEVIFNLKEKVLKNYQ